MEFLGASPQMQIVTLTGQTVWTKRVYLDSAATCLMPAEVFATLGLYLEHSCANSHTHGSASGRATTAAIAAAHDLVGRLVSYNPEKHAVVFLGNGATAALNLAADILLPNREKPTVLVSAGEHHSNMLPWTRAADIENVRYIRVFDNGFLDMEHLRSLLEEFSGRVSVVAVSALSNVTGVGAPIQDVAALAHAAGAMVVVDGSQAASHVPLAIGDVDFLALSGHKLYAPGSPGVLVATREALERGRWRCGCVGGGTVDHVALDELVLLKDIVSVFEAGTPNIPGAIMLGAAAKMLLRVGMDVVHAHEQKLVQLAMMGLANEDGIIVYGAQDPIVRAGILAMNIAGVPHGLTAAALNDFWGIAVRNDCFCAQPLVRQLLDAECNAKGFCAPIKEAKRGMVRASFGLQTTETDVLLLIQAMKWVRDNRVLIEERYELVDGNWTHKTFRPAPVFEL